MDNEPQNFRPNEVVDWGNIIRHKFDDVWTAVNSAMTFEQCFLAERALTKFFAVIKSGDATKEQKTRFINTQKQFHSKIDELPPGLRDAIKSGNIKKFRNNPELNYFTREYDKYLGDLLSICSDILHSARIATYDDNAILEEI